VTLQCCGEGGKEGKGEKSKGEGGKEIERGQRKGRRKGKGEGKGKGGRLLKSVNIRLRL